MYSINTNWIQIVITCSRIIVVWAHTVLMEPLDNLPGFNLGVEKRMLVGQPCRDEVVLVGIALEGGRG